MLSILPVLSYPELFSDGILDASASVENGIDYRGNMQRELLLQLTFKKPVPVPFSLHKRGCYFTADSQKASLKIPVCCGELKYFYPDYKNYSYLPAEDTAIHKSVAVYVDKAHRVPATPENCYTRKSGEFVPCFCTQTEQHIFHKCVPVKKKAKADTSAKEKITSECNDFLCLDESFLKNPNEIITYGYSVLSYLLK